MSSIADDDDKAMTHNPPKLRIGLAASLQDGVALADRWGVGAIIGLGDTATPDADIVILEHDDSTPSTVRTILRDGATRYFFSFGNHLARPDPASLAPAIETLIRSSGMGFMAACFAAPSVGRTVYNGHLFQHGKLLSNLLATFSTELSDRVGLVPFEDVASGVPAVRQRLAALKDQGIGLALVDAVNEAQCTAVAEACATLAVTGGPAWMSAAEPQAMKVEPHRDVVILAGALDRQTLCQIGAASDAMPVLRLDFTLPADEIVANALVWAAVHRGRRSYLIAASAPPDQVRANIPAAKILAEIAAGLTDIGTRHFLLAGNDTASTILRRLGQTKLIAGGKQGSLRWLHGQDEFAFLIKPGGMGDKNLFLSQIEPQIRLNAAAE